jgi:hypothetical protein
VSRRGALFVLVVCTALPLSTGFSGASFTATSASSAGAATAPDWAAPAVVRAIVLRQGATVPGPVAPGASYLVYADVIDSGNPASGTAAVTADVSALTAGATAVALSSGSWSVGGQPYNFRAGPFTAGATLVDGVAPFSVRTTDNAGNSATSAGFSATVDGVAPTATDVQAANGAALSGRLEAGDSLTLTFSEPIEPGSIVAGWDGSSPLNVVVRLNRATLGGNDTLSFFDAANATQLQLGTVDLGRSDYTGGTVTFGATGTPSSMAHSVVTVGGAPVSRLTLTLGTASAAARTAKGPGGMTWRPAAGPQDPAGNALVTAPAAESGGLDVDF